MRLRSRLEDRLSIAGKLPNEFNEPLVATPLLRAVLAFLDDRDHDEMLASTVRQVGKSTTAGAAANTELLLVPNSFTLLISASKDQQSSVFARKIRAPLERVASAATRKELGMRFTAHGVYCDKLGSAIEVVASNEATATGRTPTLLILDEARDVADEVYTAIAPSVLGAHGKILILSSAGRPTGFFYRLLSEPSEQTLIYRSNTNDNPRAKKGHLDWLRKRLAVVSPTAARRELDNEFISDGESLIPESLIAVAIDDRLGEMPSSNLQAYAFYDLSRKRDLTSRVVVVRDEPRRPEATDHLVVASLRVWNPRECPGGETPFEEVRADLRSLPMRFPGLEKVLVDEGAEAGSLMPFARQDASLSLLVDGFVGSLQSNMLLWGSLSGRLHQQSLSIPRDERLLAELRGLRREEFALGSKWRVMDSSRRLHRDLSLSLAGACMAAGTDDSEPLMLIGGSQYTEYMQARGGSKPVAEEPDEDESDVLDIDDETWAQMTDEERAEYEVVE